MGRIKNTAIKNIGKGLIKQHGEKFTTDFDKNKKVLADIKTINSKRTRNVLVGYITKEMQKIKKSGI